MIITNEEWIVNLRTNPSKLQRLFRRFMFWNKSTKKQLEELASNAALLEKKQRDLLYEIRVLKDEIDLIDRTTLKRPFKLLTCDRSEEQREAERDGYHNCGTVRTDKTGFTQLYLKDKEL